MLLDTGSVNLVDMPRLTDLVAPCATAELPAAAQAAEPVVSEVVDVASGRRNPPANPQKFAVENRPSLIDGMGAFAAEAIPAYKKIGEIRGESISVREARKRVRGQARIMMVEISDKRAIDATLSTDPLRYTNHSCQPNTVLRIRGGRVELYAMRAIALGEELTADYGETHHGGKLSCRCGAPNCRGAL
ncbi:MAG: hypothetical protein RJA44_602 [Pseudomonadota bacterium]